MLLLKKYQEAARCFDYTARLFPSREILNNAGIARALEAVDLVAEDRWRFAYPFEMDAKSRLWNGRKAEDHYDAYDLEEPREEIDRLLQEAREWLEKARQKDPNYATTYINLACVADLQEEYGEALSFADKAVKIARRMDEKVSLAHALIARGIARSHKTPLDEEGFVQDFEAARHGNEALATLNLSLCNSGKGLSVSTEEKHASLIEKIGSLHASDGDDIMHAADAVALLPPVDTFQTTRIYAKHAKGWSGLAVAMGHSTLFLLQTQQGYTRKTARGIEIGCDMAQVVRAYGAPAYLVSGRQGVYHVYRLNQIIFHSDAENKVKGWMIFRMEE